MGIPTSGVERDARISLVSQYTRQGLSAELIAQRLGCTPRTVQRDRKRALLTKPHPSRATPEQLERAREFLEDGCPYPEAARSVGLHDTVLRRHLPGYTWPPDVAGEFAAFVRRTEAQLRMMGIR